jgi:hypothetical protein
MSRGKRFESARRLSLLWRAPLGVVLVALTT